MGQCGVSVVNNLNECRFTVSFLFVYHLPLQAVWLLIASVGDTVAIGKQSVFACHSSVVLTAA